ncbi:TetR/AcrR family transcriptional regulator [Shimia abyssi]|uniref:TetR family transcriptional regulator n=1 Tax=Shimia abyssi TaxID=1662395 RepID=A0A2P8F826_9RHOB|nr:TetR/AcrR family transcriptional regulator [Shimia abyssi]PSL17871.1 TetR family transcriptional regulator [Shimia abyssi]
MSSTRLSPDLWVAAGFEALISQGPTALKAEPLARRLKTTKGSFYWHFKDVHAFHAAMMDQWEHRAINDLEAGSAHDLPPAQKLRHLSQITSGQVTDSVSGAVLEPSIRAWAHDNADVAAAVERVDQARLSHLQSTLSENGLSNPELARILYAANLGMADLSRRDGEVNDAALGTLVDLILALYD